MTAKKKNNGGRPSKFTAAVQAMSAKLARAGFTDIEMADMLGVTERTFNNWKKAHPEFFQSLKNNKDIADDEVVKSLYKSANGFTGPDGKYYPPNPTSMIFWLKNRQTVEWRDRHDVEHFGSVNVELIKYDEESEKH